MSLFPHHERVAARRAQSLYELATADYKERAERAEMQLAIYRLSDAFGALGAIRCTVRRAAREEALRRGLGFAAVDVSRRGRGRPRASTARRARRRAARPRCG